MFRQSNSAKASYAASLPGIPMILDPFEAFYRSADFPRLPAAGASNRSALQPFLQFSEHFLRLPQATARAAELANSVYK